MSRSGRKNRGPVPNRWMHCPRKASDLIVSKFLAFKTPLNENFDDLVPMECRFTPKFIFDYGKSKKIKFGMWIDLTNTSRFYDKSEVEREDCRYTKLQCRGHGETPSREQTNVFISIVHTFITKNPLESIAVHCTHGFNRTGFLIVSYLVEKMDCALEIAMEMFSKVRPPGIYKQDYIDELYRRYDDPDDIPPAPELPDWCFEEEASDDTNNTEVIEEPFDNSSGYSSASSSSASGTGNQNHRRKNGKIPVFMAGIPGVEPFAEQPKAFQLQKQVQVMCHWRHKGFPGCQPVSMDCQNIELLHLKPYRVSWKADGTRYMMLIDGEDEVYFFDRDHNIFKVSGLRFVHRKDLRRHLTRTLIDGEMVIDKVDGKDIPRYLAYDIIMFEEKNVGEMPFFPNRLQYIEYEIIKPRILAIEAGLINRQSEPFSIRKKDFWHVTQAASLLGEKFARSLSHEPDGLIFQPSKEPYVTGRCDEVLKWKPLDMNSVDFRLKIIKEGGTGIVARKVGQLYVGQLDRPFGVMKYTSAIKDLDNKIIECKFEDGQWKFMRERTDKSFPNSYNTAKAVCGSIQKPVTKEFLLSFIERRRFDDDNEIMPPPAKRVRR